ncbi:hypothetical protein Ocin01_03470 [Orchesella cincta]|uniref:Uncharacterized protein n=1 Tax=Orchesella cincta TaxID=48709 RepID=A0A1D2ND96_ORCCI|nr:hypothetical protein Ocin01_03470 [Orchesella cincta]
MRDQDQQPPRLPMLENLDLLLKSTQNFSCLVDAAEKDSIVSTLEKDTILTKFGTLQDQQTAFYLLLNSKPCSVEEVQNLLSISGNENAASVLTQPEELSEKEKWDRLQKVISNNIDRLSSHTMNLGLVLSFASGIGLISGKDREIIANISTLEIDQLKQFYKTVSYKEEDAYEKLLKVLKMTNNNWALSVLHIKDC